MFPIAHVLLSGGEASHHNEDRGTILIMLDAYCFVWRTDMYNLLWPWLLRLT